MMDWYVFEGCTHESVTSHEWKGRTYEYHRHLSHLWGVFVCECVRRYICHLWRVLISRVVYEYPYLCADISIISRGYLYLSVSTDISADISVIFEGVLIFGGYLFLELCTNTRISLQTSLSSLEETWGAGVETQENKKIFVPLSKKDQNKKSNERWT